MTACSNQAIYEAVQASRTQASRTNDCAKLPQNAYDECITKVDKPYEEYQNERQILLED